MTNKFSMNQLYKVVMTSMITDFGSLVFSFGLGLFLIQHTGSVFNFAISQVIGPTIGILTTPLVGPMIDKYNRKHLILFNQLLIVISTVVYIMIISATNIILLPTFILIIILKISNLFVKTAYLAASVDLVNEDHLVKLRGYEQTTSSLAGVLAPIVGAMLYAVVEFNIFSFILIISSVIAILLTMTVKFIAQNTDKDITTNSENESTWTLFKNGLNYIKKQKFLLVLMAMAAILNLIMTVMDVGLPILLIKFLNLPSTNYGFVSSTFVLGIMLAGLLIGGRKKGFQSPLSLSYRGMIITGLCAVLQGLVALFVQSPLIITILFCLINLILGVVISFTNIPMMIWLSKSIPESLQGRVFSVLNSLAIGLQPIGIILYGVLFGLQNFNKVQLGSAIFIVSGITVIIFITAYIKLTGLNLKNAEII